ncbi:MAG: hypothetical protein ACM3Q1_16290 [Bacteroidales bacterium]
MADDSNRIGATRLSTGLGQVRPFAGGGVSVSGNAGDTAVQASGDSAPAAPRGSFGPRGSRMLPADYPLDQLDRRAARGTYLDILV